MTPDQATVIAAIAAGVAGIGAIVTAVATIGLWKVTSTLARETTRMADATGQPQVVATLRTNQWSRMYTDLSITNTGNATAFDITIEFEPPLEVSESSSREGVPFQNITVLKPGEALSAEVGSSVDLLEKRFWITASWLRRPNDTERESLSYAHSMSDYKDSVTLGEADPLIEIAEQVKKIREDWRSIAGGSKRVQVDSFITDDRQEEQRALERRYGRGRYTDERQNRQTDLNAPE